MRPLGGTFALLTLDRLSIGLSEKTLKRDLSRKAFGCQGFDSRRSLSDKLPMWVPTESARTENISKKLADSNKRTGAVLLRERDCGSH